MSSWLFIPGNNLKMLSKIRTLSSDCFIIDLEDAVPDIEKDLARKNVKGFLEEPLKQKEIYVRINSFESKEFKKDIEAIPSSAVKGLVLSKCEASEEVDEVSSLTNLKIIPLIESLAGYTNLEEILSHPNVERVAFGSIDMAHNLKIRSGDVNENPLLNEMRLQISLCSKIFGKQNPIDSPLIQIDDLQKLQSECEYARKIGFSGKLSIHPKQLEVIQTVFGYSNSEIQLAKEIVERYEGSKIKTFSHKSVMVDKPVYLAMKDILVSSSK